MTMQSAYVRTLSYHRASKRTRNHPFFCIYSLLAILSTVTALLRISFRPLPNSQRRCTIPQFQTRTTTTGSQEALYCRGLKIDDRCTYDHLELFNRQNIYSHVAIKSTVSNDGSIDNGEVWKVGNVEDDFYNLERQIMYSNADQNLMHEERLEALDYFAQQRMPVASVMRTKLVVPGIAIFVLSQLLHKLIYHRHVSTKLHGMAILCQQTIRTISLAQFLSVIIVGPLVILSILVHRENKLKKTTSLNQIDPASEYFKNLRYLVASSKSMDDGGTLLSSSTRDYVKCLLEQWISCILGVILSGSIWIFASIVMPGTVKIPLCGLLPLQILTRLGVMSSLQQYQSLWFALFRKQQPRPMPWTIWVTQNAVTNASNNWFLAFDVVSLSLSFPVLLMSLPAMVVSSTLLWCSVVLSEKMMTLDKASHRDQTILAHVQQLSKFSVTAFLVWSLWSCRQLLIKASTRRTSLLARISLSNIVSISIVAVAIFGPICHMLAMRRLIDLAYRHNASLAMTSEDFEQATAFRHGTSSWKWRYRLRWREPQRVHVTLRKWWKDFWYSFFWRGSVDEKLRQEQQRKLREYGTKARGLSVLQTIAAERLSANFSTNDRSQWKIQAMKRIAQKHQDDYSNGSYDDPLGVAVYRTLGIGLGFNFDHMSTMYSKNPPSIRRLQSRAAKSAIRRVNDIYNAEGAITELTQIADIVERQKRASTLRQKAEVEVKKLGNRLTDLVPADLSWDESDSEVKVEQFHAGNYLGSSKHKFKIHSIEAESPALKNLLYNYTSHSKTDGASIEIDYLNPMGVHDLPADEEFIREWSRNNEGVRNTKYFDDDENVIETILV